MRKVCVVTGSRADFGLLYWVMKEINHSKEFQLQLIATGMHLSPEFGSTYKIIEKDGFNIDEKIEMILSSDTNIGIAKSVGLATISFSESFNRLKPDLIVVLGDRYEILAAVQTALFMKIPVAHIAGGDITEGAFDESIRHAITKMSHLHFATNEDSKKRIIQMGENPQTVFNVGSPGIDNILKTKLMTRTEFESSISFKLKKKNLLVTFHPITLEDNSSEQLVELLSALEKLSKEEYGLIITKPNSDTGGRELISLIEEFGKENENVSLHSSLGQLRYYSAMKYVDIMVGNSSSGLYEAPSFKIPTINIGDRQKGRLKSNSVIDAEAKSESIYAAILKAESIERDTIINPYGTGNSSDQIIEILKDKSDFTMLLKKPFYEMS